MKDSDVERFVRKFTSREFEEKLVRLRLGCIEMLKTLEKLQRELRTSSQLHRKQGRKRRRKSNK